jgi:phosphoribosyl 1,2-cyclic phosphodiesterase
MAGDFSVTFWGVRGSIACPGPDYLRYGGNTSCLELRCDGRLLIFDAGTGLRPLGEQLKGQGPLEIDLFLTHSHLDHIIGIPFFKPLFNAANKVTFWAGHLLPEHHLRDVICTIMVAPLFPVPIDIFAAKTTYNDFTVGETLTPQPGIALRTARLNHPNGATGYRIEFGGNSICYVTDTEHVAGALDANIVALAKDADILIYDSTYTDAEYPRYKGWGHSTWSEGLRLADAARAKTFVAFHHDPSHKDNFLDGLARDLAAARPGSLVAREGMTLQP